MQTLRKKKKICYEQKVKTKIQNCFGYYKVKENIKN
jgi:hypothetical protein